MAEFEFASLVAAMESVLSDAREALGTSSDERVRALLSELPVAATDGSDGPLTLAFVGQYDAGKSTILRVLTGRTDITIGSDVTTDAVSAFEWNGVLVHDTPGIHAGRPEHDEITYAAIDRAHLLVFVLTNELFDTRMARHFRELAFDRTKAREMMLVVNKMGQDPGDASIKLPDVARVLTPLTPQELRTTFIDARSALDAEEEKNARDRADLLEIANIDTLIGQMNGFIQEKGHLGRLAAPVHRTHIALVHAVRLGQVDDAPGRAALELLHRKKNLLLESRTRLKAQLWRLIEIATADIAGYGDVVAEGIEPGSKEESVKAAHADAQRKAESRCAKLVEEMTAAVDGEMNDLIAALHALANGILARQLTEAMAVGVQSEHDLAERAFDGDVAPIIDTPDDKWRKAKRAGDTAKHIGEFIVARATGPGAAAARFGSAMAARGSDLHHIVYAVGKWAGVAFKPWGAVNVARHIGIAGQVLGAVGGVLAVVGQVQADRQQEQYEIQLRDARNMIRASYRDAAAVVAADVRTRVDDLLVGFHDAELGAVDEEAARLVGERDERGNEAGALSALERRCHGLLLRIQGSPQERTE